MKRTPMLIALATSATLVLTACGRGDDGPGGDATPTTGAAVDTGNITGEIEVWAMGAEGEKLQAFADKFMAENSGTTISVTAVPWDGAYDKFSNAITAGTTPDVAMIGTTWMGDFASQDALDPVPAEIDNGVFFEGAQGTNVVDGTAYGVPWYVETRLVYYRSDIAEEAGYTEVPTDWEGFKQMAADMQEKGGAEWGINLQPGGTGSWQTVVPFGWSNGAEIASADGYTFDTPEMTEAVAYFQSFFTDGISNPSPPEEGADVGFVSGDIPMFVSGPWMMSIVEEAGGEGFADKYDVAPIPTGEGGESSSFVGGSNLGVFADTEARDLSWAFVQYMIDPATQVEWYQEVAALPSVKSAWEDPALADDEKLAKFGTALETAQAPPSFPTWEQVVSSLDGELEKVAKSGLDPAEALAKAQAAADSAGTGQ